MQPYEAEEVRMLHGTSKQVTCELLQAQLRLFEEAARAAGLTREARDLALRQAAGPQEATRTDWREAAAPCGGARAGSPDLLRRIGHLTHLLIVASEAAQGDSDSAPPGNAAPGPQRVQ